MDARHFDRLARALSAATSRRGVLTGLLAGLVTPLARREAAGKDRKQRDKRRGRAPRRALAQQEEPCWRAGACLPKKGSNVSRCDLAGSTAFVGLDCTRCNVSRANLRGANATGATFTRANLSGACLVDADFSDAIFANSTNLYNAIFCRTTMPDGTPNNSGCDDGTDCCPTCIAEGASCGTGIGGSCCADLTCIAGTCQVPPVTCSGGTALCQECQGTPGCSCRLSAADPTVTVCAFFGSCDGDTLGCTSDAQCNSPLDVCVDSDCQGGERLCCKLCGT